MQEKAFDKNSTPFHHKHSQQFCVEGIYIIKSIYDKPTTNILFSCAELKAFPPRSRTG